MWDFGKAPRTRKVSAANLEHECFEQESTACFDGGRERG